MIRAAKPEAHLRSVMSEPIATLNDESLRSNLRDLVRETVEDTLNGPLEAKARGLVGAGRHGRTAERVTYPPAIAAGA